MTIPMAEGYSQLIPPPPLAWRLRYRISRLTAKTLVAVPLVPRALRAIAHKLLAAVTLADDEVKNRKQLGLLNRDLAGQPEPESKFGYDELQEIAALKNYQAQVTDPNFKNAVSESPVLYDAIFERVSAILKNDPAVKTFVNFGVSFAHIDSVLAARFPSVKFIGIDRSEVTKTFNERCFSSLTNLEFIAGDVFELLASKRDFKNAVFFHTRTMLVIPPSVVSRLYARVKDSGFKYVVGLEQIGYSRETDAPYEFSDEPKASVLFRTIMFLHNYPGMLKQAGYRLTSIKALKTAHPHEDFRILAFTATL